MKKPSYKFGDQVQYGVPDTNEYDTGHVTCVLPDGNLIVYWEVANEELKERPDDPELSHLPEV